MKEAKIERLRGQEQELEDFRNEQAARYDEKHRTFGERRTSAGDRRAHPDSSQGERIEGWAQKNDGHWQWFDDQWFADNKIEPRGGFSTPCFRAILALLPGETK